MIRPHSESSLISRPCVLVLCLLFIVGAFSTALADIKVEPDTTVQVGQEVFFDGSAISIPEAVLLSNGMIDGEYEWDFGDDYMSIKGISISHFYMRPGTYTVTLNVTDINGATTTETTTITVIGQEPKLPPRPAIKPILELKFEGDLNDTSPNGLTAQWKNGEGSFVRGAEGQAADLTNGSYIEILDLNGILSGMDELTISVWAKKKEPSTQGYLIDKNGAYYLNIKRDDSHPNSRNSIKGYIETENDSAAVSKWPASETANNLWHHYAITYNGSLIKLFIDGIEYMWKVDHKGPVIVELTGKVRFSTDSLLIGKKSDALEVFEGYIDEVKIYDKALTTEEVATGFELWHADFHGHLAQYIYAQIPTVFTNDPTNKIKVTITGDNSYSKVIYHKNNLQTEEKFLLNNSELPAGNYTLTAQILDSSDNILDELKEKFAKPYNGIPKVGIDENNAIRVNGELFFPVTPYCISDIVENYTQRYINSVFGKEYSEITWEGYLDKVEQYNLKAIGPHRGFGRHSDPSNIEEFVNSHKDHNATCMWSWVDEPYYHQVLPPMHRSWTYLSHKLDPQHLVSTTIQALLWHQGSWDDENWGNKTHSRTGFTYLYSGKWFGGKRIHTTDVPSLSGYFPISSGSTRLLAFDLDTFNKEHYGLIPYMCFLAAPPGESLPERLRMFAWLAVVHGAKGISWFTHPPPPTAPENYGVMAEFFDHIENLTPIVLATEPNRTVTDSSDKVDTMIREDSQGNIWIFTVRITDASETNDPPIDVTFTVDGLTSDMDVIEPAEFSKSVFEYKGDKNLTSERNTFSFTLNNTPIIPGTLEVSGHYKESWKYWIPLYDNGNGNLYSFPTTNPLPTRNAYGTVNYTTGEVFVDFGEVAYNWRWGPLASILEGEDTVRATYRPVRSDRTISHTGNTFTDTFAPNAVHIYRIPINDAGNQAPVFEPISNKVVNKNETLTFTVAATDPDSDPITYSAWNLPEGATFVDQTFSWTPNDGQVGIYNVTFVASDGKTQTTQTIIITVNGINQAPKISPIDDKSVDENSLLSFTIDAVDPDGDEIIFSIEGLPSGAVFADQTFNWTPSFDQAGTYEVTFIASDGQAQDSITINIKVNNINQPPIFNAIYDRIVHANQTLTFTVEAIDPDGDKINYSASDLPTGSTFINQVFSWTPSQDDIGSYQITFIASDGQDQNTEMITVTVTDVDIDPPSANGFSPNVGEIQVPINSLVTLHVTDNGTGVDANSVTITLNDDVIYTGNTQQYEGTYGICHRMGTNADYFFSYQANEIFDFNKVVKITVNAADLASNAMDEYTYSFLTEMRSFGKNKKVSSLPTDLSEDIPVTMADSLGNIWVAWHAGIPGSRNIYVSVLAAETEEFAETISLTSNDYDQCNPDMVIGTDDTIYIVWQDNTRGNWDICVAMLLNGQNWSEIMRVTDSNDNEVNPAIAVDKGSPNRAYIAWQDGRNGNQDIYMASSSNGFITATISKITSNSADQLEPDIAIDSDDTITIVWTDMRNSSSDIYGAASNSGTWTNVPFVSNTHNQSSPAIAAEPTGPTLHLLWVDDTPGHMDIYYAAADGLTDTPLTGTNIIDDTSAANQLIPAIISTANDLFGVKVFACWQDQRNILDENGDTDIYFAEISSGYAGTNILVGDEGVNADQNNPTIGIDIYGHPYIIWADNRNGEEAIYYAGGTFIDPIPLAAEDVIASIGATVGVDPNAINDKDNVSVIVPAQACTTDLTISISRIKNPPEFSVQCPSIYDFGPSGMEFNYPVTVTIPYDPEAGRLASAYWYDSLTGALSKQGITDIDDIVISPSLHALSFKTTHFTLFYLVLGDDGDGGGTTISDEIIEGGSSGGGGGGCSINTTTGYIGIAEFALPYVGLSIVMAILRLRDLRKRKTREAH